MTYRLPSILAGLTALEPVNLPLDGQIDRRFTKRITRMTDPKAIDLEAIAQVCRDLTDDRSPTGYDRWFIADLLSALSAALSEARGKVGEAERERDEARDAVVLWKTIAESAGNHELAMTASRDAALAELAKLRAEADKPKPMFVGIDLARGPDRTSWGCTCGRRADTQYGLYHDCPDPHCPSRPSPPKDPTHD